MVQLEYFKEEHKYFQIIKGKTIQIGISWKGMMHGAAA
jgi:hypothetical protein